ncbi:YXWGXW repeat-containing protein [Massilia sp. TWR1-2-2]|uniref:YXWGXW repeat-containing protein n=1 Tax=Massilia sp. TWR1-2-2 TaxID=2804584 RepID=UPI003CE693C5
MMKKLLIATLVAGSLGTITLPAAAEVIVVRQAPPALRAERVPEARRGHTWIPGHWEWKRNHHTWVRGTWVRDRRGYVYNQPTWAERDGRWEMTRGQWARGDRDGDGVPNRMDRDKDGDGVRNSQDRRPNNPNRN